MNNPRRANGYRRDQVRRRVLAEENDCWICGLPVDKTLKTPHPLSAEVDEVIPVCEGGSPIDRRNCRLSHRRCNVGRNRKRPRPLVKPLETSRRWGATPPTSDSHVGSSRVDLQACKLEYSIVSPK